MNIFPVKKQYKPRSLISIIVSCSETEVYDCHDQIETLQYLRDAMMINDTRRL